MVIQAINFINLIHLFNFASNEMSDTKLTSKSLREYIFSSVESQKGAITIQICSIENQKGAIAIDFVQQ